MSESPSFSKERFRVSARLICPTENSARVDGAAVALTPKAVAVLSRLAQAHPDSVSRSHLLDQLWGDGGSDEALSQVVSEIRRKLKDDARSPLVVRTVHKYGYQLAASPQPVTSVSRRGFRVGAIVFASLISVSAVIFWWLPAAAPETTALAKLQPLAATGQIEIYPRVSDDGLYLSYSQYNNVDDRWSMVVRHRNSGDTSILGLQGASLVSPVYHANSDQLAYLRYQNGECSVMVSSRTGKRARTVAECLDEGLPALIDFSPDAQRIAFTATTRFPDLGRGISTVDLKTAEVSIVTSPEGAHITDHTPRFGPGDALGFLRQDFRSGRVALHILTGSDEQVLTPEFHTLTGFAWTPAGQLLVLLSDAYMTRIAELDDELRIRRHIATIPLARHLEATGSNLMFSARYSVDADIAEVRVTEDNQAEVRRVTRWNTRERLPRRSPDARRLAFVSDQSGSPQVWQYRPERKITDLPSMFVHSLDWIDDDNLVVGYVDKRQENHMAIVDAQSGNVTAVESCTDPLSVRADRSGRRILAVSGSSSSSGAICKLDLETMEATYDDDHATISLAVDESGNRYQAQFSGGLKKMGPAGPVGFPFWFDPVLAQSWDVRDGVVGVVQQVNHQQPESMLRFIVLATGDELTVPLASLATSGGIDLINSRSALVTLEGNIDWDLFAIDLDSY